MSEIVEADFELVPQEPQEEDGYKAFATGIRLPTYNEVDDKKALNAVKQCFSDFHYNEDDDLVKQYATPERLATYIEESVAAIGEAKEKGDRDKVKINAAIAGRFWYLAHCIDVVLTGAKYGENGMQKVIDSMQSIHWGVSTIYATRAVARKLTSADCWLLGARGAKPNHLRKLANIKDDGTRQAIIQAFMETVSDTRDDQTQEQALKKFISAVNAPSSNKDFAQIGTSDPTQVLEDEELFPDYAAGMKMLKTLEKMLKDLSDNDKMVDAIEAVENIYVTKNMPDAEERLENAIAGSKKLLGLARMASTKLSELVTALDAVATGLTIQDGDAE